MEDPDIRVARQIVERLEKQDLLVGTSLARLARLARRLGTERLSASDWRAALEADLLRDNHDGADR